ncbi:uncharacterized protein EV422DRAFT_572586 [Fimicolochytrium jonesii]|uniref:uncharacterized protein n=1 Tax=Fimicolochytrium jonesii TaxID=1396493 RepID=UPI0022FEDAC2|nr:uncharacterized protein EV422DRAFT_572586 [Fimicolochytrium jonesii]KAI8815680.1 hypothetical protein EV422DRAFT_572586 [Fimicolochytrium jonesii]
MALNFSDPAVLYQAVAAAPVQAYFYGAYHVKEMQDGIGQLQTGLEYCTGIATQLNKDIGGNDGSAIVMGCGWPLILLGS